MIYNQNNYTNITLGNNPSSIYDIAKYGCYVTSMSNMFQYIGIHLNPVEMNNKLRDSGCFAAGNGLYLANTITQAFSELREYNYNGYPIGVINEALNNPNKVVILGVDYRPTTDFIDWHFVGLYSTTQIVDPAGGVIRPISTYKIIKTVVFEKVVQPTPQPVVEQPQPVQNNIVQITAQQGDGISHLLKRAGRSDFADPQAWAEFAQLNNGQDRVFAGQVYNISNVKLNNTPVPLPMVESTSTPVPLPIVEPAPTPVQVAPSIVIEGNTATVQPTVQEIEKRIDFLEGELQYRTDQILVDSNKKVDNKGRIFGVSKKLTVQLAGAITFMTSLQTVANTELKDVEIAGYPFALWITVAITLVTALHTVSQSIVDYKEKK